MESQGLGKQSMLSKVRGMLWPIYGKENKKFIPMSLMMICVLFVYTLCRDLKDTVVMTCAVGGGSAMLSMLKFAFVLPLSFVFMAVFIKLSNKFSEDQMFYGILIFFVSFFVLFGFVLFPNAEHLHGSPEFVAGLREKYPKLHWFIPCITNWTFMLSYVMAELWGTAVISLLFWKFANKITKSTEAPRFFSLFGFVGNLGLIASGELLVRFAGEEGEHKDPALFAVSLKWEMLFAAIFGILMMVIYVWMQKNVVPDPELVLPDGGIKKPKKPKMGVWESIVYVVTNPYIMLIAFLVLAYGMSNALNENLWKALIKVRYPDRNDYVRFMGGVSKRTGFLTMALMLLGTNVVKKCKWRTSALITPLFVGLTFVGFFGLVVYRGNVGNSALIWGTSLLDACVWLGLYQVACSKGVKYSFFDSTKNMAYLPLDSETKLKSQAAVEVVGGRMGKAGSSALITLLCSNIFGTGLESLDPGNMWIMAITCFIVLAMWVVAVLKINPKVVEKMKEKAAEEKETQAELDAQKASVGASK
ncbi:ADP,ATP carrier protein 1 [Clostridia bacterium]|nr:ADP,ATP carrier protein 1 [Clostridia bacterium]